MNARLVVIVTAVFAAGAVGGFIVLRRRSEAAEPSPRAPHPAAPSENPHGRGIDRATAPIGAMFTAPEGKTPCESALNAIHAEQDASKARGVRSHFVKVAERDDFLARCQALPDAVQKCLVPKYLAEHRDDCQRVKPTAETLKPMFEARADEAKDVVPPSDLPPPRGAER